jgi:aubergine-like protein
LNLAIQILWKLGGKPWAFSPLPSLPEHLMVCGVDVCRADARNSVVAFTASYDLTYGKYYSDIQIKGPREEIVTKLNPMVEKACKTYYDHNGCLPTNVIVYRDGVSTAEEQTVLEFEATPIADKLKQIAESLQEHLRAE